MQLAGQRTPPKASVVLLVNPTSSVPALAEGRDLGIPMPIHRLQLQAADHDSSRQHVVQGLPARSERREHPADAQDQGRQCLAPIPDAGALETDGASSQLGSLMPATIFPGVACAGELSNKAK